MYRFARATATSAFALLAITTAHAADAAGPTIHLDGGFFGSVMGSYLLESPSDDWKFIGFEPQDYSAQGLGDGFLGAVDLGYRWGVWDAAVAFQYANLGTGDASATQNWPTPLNEGRLKANHFAVDAEIGYNTVLGSHSMRAAAGLRYAEWNNTVETLWSGNVPAVNGPVYHEFHGLGPVAKLDGSVPVGDGGLSLEYGLAASVLFGDIDSTSNNPAYNCSGCTKTDTTAYSLEGEIGVGWNFAGSARAVVGWQAQYWGDVNVEVTDTDFGGTNAGKSGHWLTGPFLRVNF